MTQKPEPEIYLSFWQAGPFSKHLVIRTSDNPKTIASAVQHELRVIEPTVSVEQVKTMEQIRDESVASRSFATQLLTGFSLMGSALTLIGIYGVLTLAVASRRREIGIRAAVGAEGRDIRNMIFADGFRLIGGGLLLGVASALVLSHILRALLFRVGPNDIATFALAGVSFAAVASLACWVPSRRAARVEPAEALRYE